jgi:CubicO group peptidase (beta-lactamase class C family)
MKLKIFFLLSLAVAFTHVFASAENSGPQSVEEYLFKNNDHDTRKGPRTDGFLVIQNGHLIFEKYARGYDENKPHIMWSVSKTVMALLYGVALKEGLVQLDESICTITNFDRKEQCQIKIQDILSWSSGITWKEEYEGAVKPTESSVLAMIYGEGYKDMAHFVMGLPMEKNYKPGEAWRYSSGDSVLGAYLLSKIYIGQDLRKVFKTKIFEPLGMTHSSWESDDAGTLAGAYYFYSSTHDLARIGELLLGKGKFRGREIFKAEFWNFMTRAPESFKNIRLDDKKDCISGSHIWINRALDAGVPKSWPDAPDDTVSARGHWGQYLAVIPSLDAIIIRIGDTRDHSVSLNEILKRTLPLLKGSDKFTVSKVADKIIPETYGGKSIDTPSAQKFKNSIMDLGLGFTAKNFCSCLFVTRNSEKECRDYAALDQVNPKLKVDLEKKETTSSLFWFFSRQARYRGEGLGCVLL